MSLTRRVQSRLGNLLPRTGFYFDRPIVVLQSDDWGRVGLRDREGLEELRAAGMNLGERPYDFYTLETSDDLTAIAGLLKGHRDSVGRHPCMEMNFITANLDFQKALGSGELLFRPLAEGFPAGWDRPNLINRYREGIAEGLFSAALHGISHFCLPCVERSALQAERGDLLRTLWRSGTPYIHWRMPWIGYEYWNPEKPSDEQFLKFEVQRTLIGQTVGFFAKLFSSLPRSACAPGYRANDDTHRAWSEHGIRIAQNGPGRILPPHFGKHDVLQLTRAVEFEPATDPAFSLELCLTQSERCFELEMPAIVSIHSINFHSTVENFRSRTAKLLDQFFGALESKHPDLLYLRDEDLYEAIQKGKYDAPSGAVRLNVSQKKFYKSAAERNAP